MKVTSGHPAGSTPPLAVLKKDKTQLLGKAGGRGLERGAHEGKTVDRVKEYMEQKFYEQFMPKRDVKSRIRKLALDKDTLRRASGNSRRPQPPAASSEAEAQPQKKAAVSVKRKSRKQKAKRSLSKPPKEICAMVGRGCPCTFTVPDVGSHLCLAPLASCAAQWLPCFIGQVLSSIRDL
ncbi:hypothetical protein Esti_004061 [Eimeria stiedai]